jgi:hypothetical protein
LTRRTGAFILTETDKAKGNYVRLLNLKGISMSNDTDDLAWFRDKLHQLHDSGAEKWRTKAVLRYLLKTRHIVTDEELDRLNSLIEQTEIWPAGDERENL